MANLLKTAYIVSGKDGHVESIKLFSPNGEEIPCIVSVDIKKIDCDTYIAEATVVLSVSFGRETSWKSVVGTKWSGLITKIISR